MNPTILEIDMISIACDQNQIGISHVKITSDSAETREDKCLSYSKDDFGSVTYDEIDQANVCNLLCEFFPTVDEHNQK